MGLARQEAGGPKQERTACPGRVGYSSPVTCPLALPRVIRLRPVRPTETHPGERREGLPVRPICSWTAQIVLTPLYTHTLCVCERERESTGIIIGCARSSLPGRTVAEVMKL